MATLYFGTTLINQAEANVATVVESLTKAEYEALAFKDPNTLYVLTDVEDQEVQSDWDQNDETAPDYVKNRPGGYYEDTYSTVFEEATVNFTFSESANRYEAELGEELCLKVAGEEFLKVTFDGVEYKIELDSLKFEPDETTPFGLIMLVTDPVDFLIYTTIEGDTHTVEISIVEKSPVPIDAKFLPDTVATKADIEAAVDAAKSLVITITGNSTDGYAADATFEAIKEAYINSRPIYARLYEAKAAGDVGTLFADNFCNVEFVEGIAEDGPAHFRFTNPGGLEIDIVSSGSITVRNYTYATEEYVDSAIEAAIGAAIGGSY